MSGFYLIIKAKKETPTVNNSRILTYFDNPIEFISNKGYEMALVGLDTVHSYTNINSKNNVFRYSPNSGTSNYTIYIEEGASLTSIFKLKCKNKLEVCIERTESLLVQT